MAKARIILKISTKGIASAEICADTEQQQSSGHALLAAITGEMRILDAALKAYRPLPRQKVYCIAVDGRILSGQDRVTHTPITHIDQGAAFAFTKDAAEELAVLLRRVGHKPRLAENKYADRDNVIDNFADVWAVEPESASIDQVQ